LLCLAVQNFEFVPEGKTIEILRGQDSCASCDTWFQTGFVDFWERLFCGCTCCCCGSSGCGWGRGFGWTVPL